MFQVLISIGLLFSIKVGHLFGHHILTAIIDIVVRAEWHLINREILSSQV